MRERTTMLGGSLIATGMPHGGFLVEAFLPAPADNLSEVPEGTTAGTTTRTAAERTTGNTAGKPVRKGST
jgi:hypothetical protein